MLCPHCRCENAPFARFDRPVEGGRAYAQECRACRRIIGLRPRVAGDPEMLPAELTSVEIARLLFIRWLHQRAPRELDLAPAA